MPLAEMLNNALDHLIDKQIIVEEERSYVQQLVMGVFREWLADLPERDGRLAPNAGSIVGES